MAQLPTHSIALDSGSLNLTHFLLREILKTLLQLIRLIMINDFCSEKLDILLWQNIANSHVFLVFSYWEIILLKDAFEIKKGKRKMLNLSTFSFVEDYCFYK